MRDLTLIAALTLAVPVCQAQQAPASHLNNVTTPALHFVGLATVSGPTAATADIKPNAPQTLPGNTIVLNVPFSFESPEPELKGAIVRCTLLAHPNSAHIAEEQIAIPIGGKSMSGTAPVTFAPVNNRNVAVAHAYTCFFELTNGKSTTYALGDKGPPWARSQTGSVLLVRGTIP